MIQYSIISIFPELFENFLRIGTVGKAVSKRKLKVQLYNLRDFTNSKHKKVDDRPYGGGSDMILTYQPIKSAIDYALSQNPNAKIVFTSPSGVSFNSDFAINLRTQNLVFVCGRYGGIDHRIVENHIDYNICIGDYILSGGEIPTMVIIESTIRLVDGVLGNKLSCQDESFNNNLLFYPKYTRPKIVDSLSVPEVLYSGNHKSVEDWKKQQRKIITEKNRPDLIQKNKKNP